MTFVTRLTLRSGDRIVLDETVGEIKEFVARKGAEMRGPHPRPPTDLRVPLYRRLEPDHGEFRSWSHTVYTRDLEIIGHDAVARAVASRSFPECLHVAVEIEQLSSAP